MVEKAIITEKPEKPPKDEIIKIAGVKAKKDAILALSGILQTQEFIDLLDAAIEVGYDQGYHDSRSHYNIDKPDPPAIKELV